MDTNLFRRSFSDELTHNILPFWLDRMQDPAGGWYGRTDGGGRLVPDAPKGAILNARILWTSSSAFRLLGCPEYRTAADRAYCEVRDRFVDPQWGGVFWSLDAAGRPQDTKKQFYAIAFAVYGLAEYFRATGAGEALELAVRLYRDIEAHSSDGDGYLEACTRDWQPIADMRLSEKDRNDAKTMNTHLHILEGYTCLYRVWKDEGLRERLAALVEIFLDKILRPDGHLGLFFDTAWRSQSEMVSYGHDIEASWLLEEASDLLGDPALAARTSAACRRIAAVALEGWTEGGGMIYEYDPTTGHRDADRHWWVQAETVVGCWNRFQRDAGAAWAGRALDTWDFIRREIVCPDGEWYWSLRSDGTHNVTDDRAGFWKCPYHNGRMCMELLERTA
ncbi:MAG: AGE family epimerase/isomerase [Bacteroidales bacterium]|nr:AGE family epimerase/isomerase [Bacteroidales bacterium]